ncbi:MAG: hypothetical protein IJ911_09035 [Salinivirgaceae bacterium]|nr:hypothetical protein [Salinivirgaceae bacterium]
MSIKNIDKIFRKGVQDSEVAAPEFVWQQISDSLATRRHNNRRFWLVAASVALLVGFSVFLLSTSGDIQQQVAGSDSDNSAPAVEAAGMLEAPSFADSAVYVNDEGMNSR